MADAPITPLADERKRPEHCCTYCGSGWEISRDHVIPTSFLRNKRRFQGDWLVPSCRECNGTLGCELIFIIPERAAYVLKAYRKKYKPLFKTPNWRAEELCDVKGSLRQLIEQTMAAKVEAATRILHLKGVSVMPEDYMLELCPHLVEGKTIQELAEDLKLEQEIVDQAILDRWHAPAPLSRLGLS